MAQQLNALTVLHRGALKEPDAENIRAFEQRGEGGDSAERRTSDACVLAAFLHAIVRCDIGKNLVGEELGDASALKDFGWAEEERISVGRELGVAMLVAVDADDNDGLDLVSCNQVELVCRVKLLASWKGPFIKQLSSA